MESRLYYNFSKDKEESMFRLIKKKWDGSELWRSNGGYIICNKYRREYKFFKFLIEAEEEFYA